VRREIEHVLSENRQRAFRLIANNKFRTNPLIMSETRHGEIFKMRNPIRNFHDKLMDIHFRPCCIELKDSDMNQGGE
jgi:hypothetical protein